MRSGRRRFLRLLYLIVFVSLLLLAIPYVHRYVKILNNLSAQK